MDLQNKIIAMLEEERKSLSMIGTHDDPNDPNNSAMSRGFIAGIKRIHHILDDLLMTRTLIRESGKMNEFFTAIRDFLMKN